MTTLLDKFNRVRRGKSQADCAAEIGVSREHLNRVLYGHHLCGRKLAERIEAWSNGEISAVFMMFPDKAKADDVAA